MHLAKFLELGLGFLWQCTYSARAQAFNPEPELITALEILVNICSMFQYHVRVSHEWPEEDPAGHRVPRHPEEALPLEGQEEDGRGDPRSPKGHPEPLRRKLGPPEPNLVEDEPVEADRRDELEAEGQD